MSIYPDPVQGSASFTYTVDREGPVTVLLTDLDGKPVQTIVQNENQKPGRYRQEIYFDSDVNPGHYWITFKTCAIKAGLRITKE